MKKPHFDKTATADFTDYADKKRPPICRRALWSQNLILDPGRDVASYVSTGDLSLELQPQSQLHAALEEGAGVLSKALVHLLRGAAERVDLELRTCIHAGRLEQLWFTIAGVRGPALAGSKEVLFSNDLRHS